MKIVITGPSSCGKTTIISLLGSMGYIINDEVPRQILTNYGHLPVEQRQELMLARQLKLEDATEIYGEEEPVFFDRSLIDILAYDEYLTGRNSQPTFDDLKCHDRYDVVFVLCPLDFINDGVRIEDNEEQAEEIFNRVLNWYKKTGAVIHYISATDKGERVKKILGLLGEFDFEEADV